MANVYARPRALERACYDARDAASGAFLPQSPPPAIARPPGARPSNLMPRSYRTVRNESWLQKDAISEKAGRSYMPASA
jgi:hypothetical protein